MSDDAWLDEIKEFFVIEGVDLLESVESSFLELEKNPEDEDTINSIFRFVHNIKGSSKSVGLTNLAEFTHHLENVLSRIRSKETVASKEVVSLLLKSVDKISDSLGALQQDLSNDLDRERILKKAMVVEVAGGKYGLRVDRLLAQQSIRRREMIDLSDPFLVKLYTAILFFFYGGMSLLGLCSLLVRI